MHKELGLWWDGNLLAILGVIFFTLALLGVPASPAMAQSQDLYDCPDFTYQEQAQAIYNQDRSDPYNLDGDNDGIACEDLPSRGATGGQYSSNQVATQQVGTQATTTDGAGTTDDANNPNSDNFRCESFLRVARDANGALRRQYRGDELVTQRFEQCLSGDVLMNTIPNRNLPFTGGISTLWLAAIGLSFIVAGLSVRRTMMRRGR
jgi:hypothetical protein